MTGPTYIRAGDQFFYSHPQSGVLIVGAREEAISTGHAGPEQAEFPAPKGARRVPLPTADPQFPALPHGERTSVSSSAGVPAFNLGSHLWVG